MLFTDARAYQILFLSGFLGLGVLTRDWTLRLDLVIAVLASCLVTQVVLGELTRKNRQNLSHLSVQVNSSYFQLNSILYSLPSAAITALGLSLLLRANHWTTMALAGSVAIASKFIFCQEKKHFFNPANFGLMVALVFTGDAWVSPGQWGTDWWYLALFCCTGAAILKQVGRWETSGIFLLTYTSLFAGRNFWLGWSWDVLQHQLMSGSLLLFAFFMITDPRSIPNARTSRCLWSSLVALLAFILQVGFQVNAAIFWALFVLSPTTVFLDKFWPAPRFTWQQPLTKPSKISPLLSPSS